jgi:hypothetical protein
MERHLLIARSRRLLTHFLAGTALIVMYLVATLAVSGLALTSASTPAEAKKGGGGGKGSGGPRGGRRGRRGRDGVYVDVASCGYWREECGATYGWRTRGYYRCLRRHGC